MAPLMRMARVATEISPARIGIRVITTVTPVASVVGLTVCGSADSDPESRSLNVCTLRCGWLHCGTSNHRAGGDGECDNCSAERSHHPPFRFASLMLLAGNKRGRAFVPMELTELLPWNLVICNFRFVRPIDEQIIIFAFARFDSLFGQRLAMLAKLNRSSFVYQSQ